MSKLLKRIDYYLNKYNNSIFIEEDKLNFLLGIDSDNLEIYDNATIIKILYSALSNNEYKLIVEYIGVLENGLNKLNYNDYCNYLDLLTFFRNKLSNNEFEELYIKESDYYNNCDKLNSLGYPNNVMNIINRIIKNEDKSLDFYKYNLLLSFFNDESKITLMQILENVFILQNEEKDNDFIYTIEQDILFEEISNYFNFVKCNINKSIKKLIDNKKMFDKNKRKMLDIFNELKRSIINNKEINISFLEKNIKDNTLLAYLIIYNTELNNSKYLKEKEYSEKLLANNLNEIDILLSTYDFKIISNDIKINLDELEKKLININKYLYELKVYYNILLMLINDVDIKTFDILINLIICEDINYEYILNNIEYLVDMKITTNYVNNIKLLKENNISINNVIKYDNDILFIDYILLENNINIYKLYNIKLDSECYNYEFLKKDYSYIIDKFIEIGEYDLIVNNPSLVNDESLNIIRRCSLYNEIGNSCVNEQMKLKGNLRKSDSFIVGDDLIDEIVIENYSDFINSDLLNILNNIENSYNFINLNILDNYCVNELVYNIDGVFISRNKIIKNMNKLLNSTYKDDYKDLLFYSIIYSYPKLLTLNDINNIKDVLNVKTKKLN